MPDLTEFLRARLDEDEAAARAWLPFGNPDAAQREHIARHDPGRVLREVAAKRAILDGRWGGPDHQDMWDHAVRCLAAVYSDHPDYDPAWRYA